MTLIPLLLLMISAISNAQLNNTHIVNNRFEGIQDSYYSYPTQPDPRYNPQISLFVSKSILDFAHDLSTELLKDTSVKSQIFSPICLASSLALLMMGAHGDTFTQINKLLKYDQNYELISKPFKAHEELGFLLEDLKIDQIDPTRPREQSAWRFTRREDNRNSHALGNTPNDHIIKISNALFVQNGYNLRYEYKSVAESIYKSEITPLDFRGNSRGSKDCINTWVKEKTLGKIPYIVADDIDPSTNVILASTLYFKGFWENSFISAATTDAMFYPDGRNAPGVKVKMMANGGIFPFYEDLANDCRILGFPYKGNLTTMYIIQPNDSNRSKVRHLLEVLTADKIENMISKMAKKTAVLTFPKLHISSTIQLKQLLKKLGVTDIFDSRRSDLSLISDGLQNFQSLNSMNVAPFPQKVDCLPIYKQPSTSPILPAQTNTPIYRPPSSTFNTPSQAMPTTNEYTQSTPSQHIQDTSDLLLASTQSNPNVVYSPTVIRPTISTESYHKKNHLLGKPYNPNQEQSENEPTFILNRFGETEDTTTSTSSRSKRAVKYKVESQFKQNSQPLRLKDLILRKRITKANPGKKIIRSRRQAQQESIGLQKLDILRNNQNLVNPGLYADDILHKVDLVINEQGTEAAAATITYLRRSGTDVTFRADCPFIILIRHDPTRLPLFYGAVYEPVE